MEYTLKQYNRDFHEGSGINRPHWRSGVEMRLIEALENALSHDEEILTINVYLPHPDDPDDGEYAYELMMFTTDFDLSIYFEIDNEPVETIFGKALNVRIRDISSDRPDLPSEAALITTFSKVDNNRVLLGRAYSPDRDYDASGLPDDEWVPFLTKLSGRRVDINNWRTTFERRQLSDILGPEKGPEMRRYVLQLLRKYTDTNFGNVPERLVEVDAILVNQPPYT